MTSSVRQEIRSKQPNESSTRTKSGVEFNPATERWDYQDGVHNVTLEFRGLVGLSDSLLQSAKAVFKWYAENRSPDHLANLHTRLQHFARTTAASGNRLSVIAAEDLLNYRATLDRSTEWYLGTLAGFLKKWHSLGYTGIDESAILLLKQLRMKGNAKGVAVMTMDPEDGPFTHIEAEALQAALNSAYAAGSVDTANFVLAWLYMLLGQRNLQYASLKVCDVQTKQDEHGNRSYSVLMPSAKRRGASTRQRLVERPLVEQFGEILVEYAQGVRATYKGLIPDVEQAPLFPSTTGRKGSEGYEHHATSDNIRLRLKLTLERLAVHSERTGKPVKINARRFRSTLGTRAAEEGHGPLVIAGLLDHTDTQNVGVYTASSPAIIERIDRAVAMEMAPLAQAFVGIIKDGQQSGGDPGQRIIDLRIDRSGQAMGECGKHGFCGFAAPIACYTCRSFEAWLDGPHEAVLSHLIKHRERLLKSSDKRIASINDRTILAVAAVIQRCSEIKAHSLGGIDG